jgi:hypothetical protein
METANTESRIELDIPLLFKSIIATAIEKKHED